MHKDVHCVVNASQGLEVISIFNKHDNLSVGEHHRTVLYLAMKATAMIGDQTWI